jgi:hypothetical protein
MHRAHTQVDVCHMKNTMAAATGDATMARLFTNSNLLVGFKPPMASALGGLQQEQQQQQQQALPQEAEAAAAAAQQRVSRSMSPQEIVGGLLRQPQAGPHIPQVGGCCVLCGWLLLMTTQWCA